MTVCATRSIPRARNAKVDIKEKLEKHDTLAMVLAALITILPAALLAIGIMLLAGWLFLFR